MIMVHNSARDTTQNHSIGRQMFAFMVKPLFHSPKWAKKIDGQVTSKIISWGLHQIFFSNPLFLGVDFKYVVKSFLRSQSKHWFSDFMGIIIQRGNTKLSSGRFFCTVTFKFFSALLRQIFFTQSDDFYLIECLAPILCCVPCCNWFNWAVDLCGDLL